MFWNYELFLERSRYRCWMMGLTTELVWAIRYCLKRIFNGWHLRFDLCFLIDDLMIDRQCNCYWGHLAWDVDASKERRKGAALQMIRLCVRGWQYSAQFQVSIKYTVIRIPLPPRLLNRAPIYLYVQSSFYNAAIQARWPKNCPSV